LERKKTWMLAQDVVDDDGVEVSVDHGRKGGKERGRDWAALTGVRGDIGKATIVRGDVTRRGGGGGFGEERKRHGVHQAVWFFLLVFS
jgi:hypothetical protein